MNLKDCIREILESDKRFADDDTLLMLAVWAKKDGAAQSVIKELIKIKSSLTKGDDVARARRLVEEENVNLRGYTYDKRHKKKWEEKQLEFL